MIGFENQNVRATQLLRHKFGQVPDVGKLRDLDAAAGDAERDRLGCVMRNPEGQHLSIADRYRFSGNDGHELRTA